MSDRPNAGGARVRPASCLPGRGKHRATVALHLVSSTVLFARAGPTTQRHRPRRSPLVHGASGGLARLQVTRCHIWRLRTQRGRRAVMGWETRLGAPAGWPGTLGDGPGRRTRLVAHREARLRGQPGLVDVFPLISHSRPIAAVGARPQVLSSHLPKFGAQCSQIGVCSWMPWAAVAK